MRHRRGSGPPRGGAARRRLIWAEYDAVVSFTANSQWFSLDILQTYKALTSSTTAKCTVMRVHGYVAKSAAASSGGDRIWSGLKIADLDDTSGGVLTSAFVPNPRDNPNVDWMYMTRHTTENDLLNLVPGAIGTPPQQGNAFLVDLKSRRKLENVQETLAFVLLQDNVANVASSYHVFFRTLLALP